MADEILERIYTVPLGDAYEYTRTKRTPRAVKMLRQFISKHMKAELDAVSLSNLLNSHLWERSIQKPPRKVKVRAVKAEEKVKVYLPDEITDQEKKAKLAKEAKEKAEKLKAERDARAKQEKKESESKGASGNEAKEEKKPEASASKDSGKKEAESEPAPAKADGKKPAKEEEKKEKK